MDDFAAEKCGTCKYYKPVSGQVKIAGAPRQAQGQCQFTTLYTGKLYRQVTDWCENWKRSSS